MSTLAWIAFAMFTLAFYVAAIVRSPLAVWPMLGMFICMVVIRQMGRSRH